MKVSFFFRRAAQVLLPATLLLAACGKKDTPAPTPVVDTGKVAIINGAANVNVAVKVLVDEAEKASLNYGQMSSYQAITAGSRVFKVNGGTTTLATQTLTIDKDKNYSYFIYNTGSSNASTGLLVADDLTVPATTPSPGKAMLCPSCETHLGNVPIRKHGVWARFFSHFWILCHAAKHGFAMEGA